MDYQFFIRLKLLQIFNHIVLVVGLVYLINSAELYWLITSFIFFAVNQMFGYSCGYHRLLSHRSFKTSRFWEIVLTISGTLSAIGSSIVWVGLHRAHHANSDKVLDPHSPYKNRDSKLNMKFSPLLALKVWMYSVYSTAHISLKRNIDMVRDPFHVFMHVHYFKITLSVIALLCVVDPLYVVFVYCIPACLSFHASGALSVFTHRYGYKSHDTGDRSTNSWIISLLTFGDGWHNNHHANPGNWTIQEKWWELDPVGWFIRLIKK